MLLAPGRLRPCPQRLVTQTKREQTAASEVPNPDELRANIASHAAECTMGEFCQVPAAIKP